MHVYSDQDADLAYLDSRRIAMIGYGNQGRAQALNLRDSGLDVVVGNREDPYAELARQDGFPLLSVEAAVTGADIVMLLIPDEVGPKVFERKIAPHLAKGAALVFASAYNVAFGLITPPSNMDVLLVAPRMIGAGVRDLYVAGRGFPSFIGVAQDHSGQARELALALAKGIGSTRAGVVQVTFAQEAELDLFTEQCFGPAFGHVLTTAVSLLIDKGYPPEAVLLELYMSGELAYTMGKIAELGLVEQSTLHSSTSQYGSLSRGMRFILPELSVKMEEGLEEIRSGQFAVEWTKEQAGGCTTLGMLMEAARSLPLYQMELELRQALRKAPGYEPPHVPAELSGGDAPLLAAQARRPVSAEEPIQGRETPAMSNSVSLSLRESAESGFLSRVLSALGLREQPRSEAATPLVTRPLPADQLELVLVRFLERAEQDPALREYSQGRELASHYVLGDAGLEFYMRFDDGQVVAGMGTPDSPTEMRLETQADVLDGMFTGRINAMRAAMTGRVSFRGDARAAMGLQRIQDDLSRLYVQARHEVLATNGQ